MGQDRVGKAAPAQVPAAVNALKPNVTMKVPPPKGPTKAGTKKGKSRKAAISSSDNEDADGEETDPSDPSENERLKKGKRRQIAEAAKGREKGKGKGSKKVHDSKGSDSDTDEEGTIVTRNEGVGRPKGVKSKKRTSGNPRKDGNADVDSRKPHHKDGHKNQAVIIDDETKSEEEGELGRGETVQVDDDLSMNRLIGKGENAKGSTTESMNYMLELEPVGPIKGEGGGTGEIMDYEPVLGESANEKTPGAKENNHLNLEGQQTCSPSPRLPPLPTPPIDPASPHSPVLDTPPLVNPPSPRLPQLPALLTTDNTKRKPEHEAQDDAPVEQGRQKRVHRQAREQG